MASRVAAILKDPQRLHVVLEAAASMVASRLGDEDTQGLIRTFPDVEVAPEVLKEIEKCMRAQIYDASCRRAGM